MEHVPLDPTPGTLPVALSEQAPALRPSHLPACHTRGSLHRDPRNGPAEPTFVIFQPHSELGQDVVPQGVAELQDLRD